MVFDSIFGKPKKEVLGQARAEQFKNAWLMANQSLLAAKTLNESEDTQIEEASLVEKAKQVLNDEKESFTAESHHTEQLAIRLLPIVNDIYTLSNRFMNDADVSSAHNMAFQRILELIMERALTGEDFSNVTCPSDFSDNEAQLLQRVTQVVSGFWSVAE